MNKEEAIQLVMNKFPDRDIGTVSENENYFLVNTLSKKKSGNLRLPLYNDGLKAVDKKTGLVFTYNPIRHQ